MPGAVAKTKKATNILRPAIDIRIAVLYHILTRLRPSQLVHLNILLLQLLASVGACVGACTGTSVGACVGAACACVQLQGIDELFNNNYIFRR